MQSIYHSKEMNEKNIITAICIFMWRDKCKAAF